VVLTRDTFIGPWAGIPVAWTEDDRFAENFYRADVARCCSAGLPGVYTGGTSGEFYAMEFDEFQQIARATVEECHTHGTPAMVGCTSTYTLGAIRRAEFAASIGADAIQVALPFWMRIGDGQLIDFFVDVSTASGGLPLSIYDTARSKRTLTLDEHRRIHDRLPHYMMVKATGVTLGATREGCQSLAEFINVFVGEDQWLDLGSAGARGSCSSMVYWNPWLMLDTWSKVTSGDWESLQAVASKIAGVHRFLHDAYGDRGFTDSTYDRLGGRATGFLTMSLRTRSPYPSASEDDVETLRHWLAENFPEILSFNMREPRLIGDKVAS
jgi:4-hydroxy-tetrahydrodipicolinate synthase